MQAKTDIFATGVDSNAFKRLPSQKPIDPSVAKSNREKQPSPTNLYEPAALAAPVEGAPSITELARALKNNVDLIFQFVHDNIEFYPNYGIHKGGWGALVDGCGNPFDQSDLMVQLLRNSGYTASYVVGNIQLSATQWSNWLNVSTSNIAYAAQLLADGGFGVTYNTFTNTITLDYCWVQCTIDGTNYQFDPALKSYNRVSGISLASVLGYSRSTFLADAQSLATVTANSVQNMNEPNISADLTTYAMNLVNWINTNNSGAGINDILGGQTIIPVSGPIRNTTLPYQSGTPTIYTSLPSSVIATLQLQFGSINQTFNTSDIYGHRVSLFWNSSHQAQLYVNLPGQSGNIVATSAAQTIGNSYPLTITVTHPYASTFANEASTINLTAGAYFAIGTAWGYAGRQMAELHRTALVNSLNAGVTTDDESTIGESLSTIWWNFSGENTSGTNIINALSNCYTTFHHNIGTVGFFNSSVFTPGNFILVNFFFNSWGTTALNASGNIDATSAHVALVWHMLEATVVNQVAGVPCASAPILINSANGGSCTATITGTVHVGDVLNIFVHDSRLATNPTQISYTTVSLDTTTKIATNLAALINASPTLAAIGVTATSSTNVLRIGTFSYNNTTFTQSVPIGSEIITLASSQGTVIYAANKYNWSTVKPALSAGGYTTAELNSVAGFVAGFASATINGAVSPGGGDVLNIFVHDPALSTNPTPISYTTIAGDTTTSIATKLTTAINGSSALSGIGVTAASSGNVIDFSSLSVNDTAYTQSVTSGAETILLPNFAFATIAGTVSAGGGDVLNISVHDPALTTNPTTISYTTVAGDTIYTIASNLASLINNNSALAGIGVVASSSANVLIIESVSSNVTTYTKSVTSGSETITLYYNTGYTATIPAQANVYVGSYFQGYGYYLLDYLGEAFYGPLVGASKGGLSGDINDADCNDNCSANSPAVNGTGAPTFALEISNEPIDLFKGRYLYTNTDISVGNQGEPYELPFTRNYNSGNATNNTGLGFGWNHNYQISAASNSDGFIGFGYQSVSAAAAAIAEMYVCQDLLTSTSPTVPIQNAVTICIANTWLASQLTNNTAVINFGGENQVFARLPNGTYVAPVGVNHATQLSSAATFTYTSPDKVVFAFNASGQISTITYPFGITTTFGYTGGNLTSVTNGFRTLTLSYSGTKLTGVSDGNGRSISITEDSNNNLVACSDPLGNLTAYSYVSTGLLTSIFRPANPTLPIVTNSYDSLNRIKTQADSYGNLWTYFFAGTRSEEDDPNGSTRVWYFDAFGSTVQYTDQLNNTTTSEFDGLERVTLLTLPEGNSSAFTYNANSNILSVTYTPKPGSLLSPITNSFTYDTTFTSKVKTATDGNGNIMTYTYDPTSGRLTQAKYPTVTAGTPILYCTYNSIGLLLTTTDPSGVQTTFNYDATSHNLLSVVVSSQPGGLNLTTTFTYDAVGNLQTVQDPNGNIVSLSFDANRRFIQQTDPTPFGYVTTFTYDPNDNMTQLQRFSAGTLQQSYSAIYSIDNLITDIFEPTVNYNNSQPNPTQFVYDALRRLQQATDAQGNVYQYTYDAASRLFQLTDPTGTICETCTYTANGYLEAITDASSNLTQYAYDGLDRVSTTTYADTTTEQYVYDDNNNITQVTTRSSATIGFTYDALNETLTKSPLAEAIVSYTYDLSGRLMSASTPPVSGDPSTGMFQFSYDTAGRFFKEQYSNGNLVTLGLDSNGNVTGITYPDTFAVTRTYDQLNRLTGITAGAGTVTFGYDSLSRRISLTYGNGIVQTYRYDQSDNLIGLMRTGASAVKFSYQYNNVHQQLQRAANSSGFIWQPPVESIPYGSANAVNQYPSVNGTSYNYNSNGCLTGDGTYSYTYDTENRLTGISGGGVSLAYEYDPIGRQLLKSFGGSTTQFLYSGLQRIADYNSSGSLLNRFIFGTGVDEPLIAITSSGTVSYLHADDTGSVISASDSSGSTVNSNTYSPFGESASVNSTNFGFTGQRVDPETGLYFYKARYYSPTIGRFLQPDPIGYGTGLNTYQYVNNDPINSSDPLGLTPAGNTNSTATPSSVQLFGGVSATQWNNAASQVGQILFNLSNAIFGILPASAEPSKKAQTAQTAATAATAPAPSIKKQIGKVLWAGTASYYGPGFLNGIVNSEPEAKFNPKALAGAIPESVAKQFPHGKLHHQFIPFYVWVTQINDKGVAIGQPVKILVNDTGRFAGIEGKYGPRRIDLTAAGFDAVAGHAATSVRGLLHVQINAYIGP